MKYKRSKKSGKNMGISRCRFCGSSVSVRHSSEISDELRDSFLYVCNNGDCGAYVRIRPGSNIPDGDMADHTVRQKRAEAHYYFDMLYKRQLLTRDESYLWLMRLLGVPRNKAHIKYLGAYDCQIVIEKSIESLCGFGVDIQDYIPFDGGEQHHRKVV